MKSSDEMIASLLKRRDDYETERARERRRVRRQALLVISSGLIILTVFSFCLRNTDHLEMTKLVYRRQDQPVPAPFDMNNLLTINGTDYSVSEGSDLLPEGYFFLREITEKEANGTDLTGCKIFVHETGDMIQDFWLCQQADNIKGIAYGGGKPPIVYHSENLPEWIYTHWVPITMPVWH